MDRAGMVASAGGSRRLRRFTAAAGLWSMAYGTLAVYWATGGPGFPFGRAADPDAALSALAGLTRSGASPVMAVLAAIGVAVATAMAVPVRHAAARRTLLGIAWSAATLLALGIPDPRWLVVLAYAPIVVVGGFAGWAPEPSLLDVVTWPMINQLICIGGGIAWGAAALAYARSTAAQCVVCGRAADRPDRPSWAAGREPWIAVAIAVAVPLLYGVTRWAWAIGIPLGVDAGQLRQVHADGFPIAPAGLGTMAFVAAGLTLGLVQPWGETFPRWLPRVGGRRVPPPMAVVPATLVAILVIATGLVFVRFTLADLDQLLLVEGWAIYGPGLLWPAWGAALGFSAVAYHYRRRGRCTTCGLP
jgi:hypothetical protein